MTTPCREWSRGPPGRRYATRIFRGKAMSAHRATWIEAYGPVPEGLFVLHRCDNKPCCELSHLYLGTHADNMRDAVQRWRYRRGETHHNSKLTDAQVRDVRRRCAAGEVHRAIAREYGVSRTSISKIANGTMRPIVGRERYTPPEPDMSDRIRGELVRILHACGYKQEPLAIMFGFTQQRISAIVNADRGVLEW